MTWLIIPLCILTAIAVWAVIELIRRPVPGENLYRRPDREGR